MENISQQGRPCVLVTGRNYCNILTITRALGQAGYDVMVLRVYKTKPKALNPMNHIKADAYSKYVIKYKEIIANNDYQVIINAIMELSNPKEKMLLLPVDDYLTFL